jgi:hypothetical protein
MEATSMQTKRPVDSTRHGRTQRRLHENESGFLIIASGCDGFVRL